MALKVVAKAHAYNRTEWSLADVKAALLYADEVQVTPPHMARFPGMPRGARLNHLVDVDEKHGHLIVIPVPAAFELELSRLREAEQVSVTTGGNLKLFDALGHFLEMSDAEQLETIRLQADSTLDRAWTLPIPDGYVPVWGNGNPPAQVAIQIDHPDRVAGSNPIMRRADVAELALAAALLAELPAFPDADVADILDVRDRLHDSRIRFRQAMAAAGRALADVPHAEFGTY